MSALTIYPQHLNSNTPHIILICMLNSHRDDIADSYLCVPIQEHTAVNIGGVGDGAAKGAVCVDFVNDNVLHRADFSFHQLRADFLLALHKGVVAGINDLLRDLVFEIMGAGAVDIFIFKRADTGELSVAEELQQNLEVFIRLAWVYTDKF